MSFNIFNFNDHISQGLHSQGYVSPTPIQLQAIKPILDGRDLLGLAQTGTGKTAAFTLPILQQLSEEHSRGTVKSLIIAPTRELAEQTYTYIEKFSKRLNLRCSVIYGGVSREAQIKKLRQGADIVVACPGRLLDLANDGEINLSKIAILVLDEADQMVDKGFLPDIKRIIQKLPRKRQSLVFSATMPKEVRSLVEGLLVNHVEVAINITRPITNIQHSFYQVDSRNKSSLLKTILKEEHVGTTLVFTRTKHKARNLALQLTKNGFKATSLQGNLSQQQRQRALDGFKSGTYNILVATDIAARGIDVAGISHVINYDMPGTSAAYTHRTGRTGRASQSGEALTFTTAEDYQMIKNLERTLEGKLVYRNSPGLAAQNFSNADKTDQAVQNKTAPKVSRTHRKVRGKRSSQRNRAAAFDFGFQV